MLLRAPNDQARGMNPGILYGVCFGGTKAELLLAARDIGATYFEVNSHQVRVELSDERYAPRQGIGMDNRIPRFAADFRAEVI